MRGIQTNVSLTGQNLSGRKKYSKFIWSVTTSIGVMIVTGEVLHKLSRVETLARFGIGLGFSLCAMPSRSCCISNFRGARSDRSLGEILVNFLTTELLIYIHIIY